MHHYVGLDVSLKSTSICILDKKGKRLQEAEVDSTPEAIHEFLLKTGLEIEQIGLESGSLTHYLKSGLLKKGYQVAVMESRKMTAILATIINTFQLRQSCRDSSIVSWVVLGKYNPTYDRR